MPAERCRKSSGFFSGMFDIFLRFPGGCSGIVKNVENAKCGALSREAARFTLRGCSSKTDLLRIVSEVAGSFGGPGRGQKPSKTPGADATALKAAAMSSFDMHARTLAHTCTCDAACAQTLYMRTRTQCTRSYVSVSLYMCAVSGQRRQELSDASRRRVAGSGEARAPRAADWGESWRSKASGRM